MLMSLTSVSAATKPIVKPIRVYVQDKEIRPAAAPVIQGGRVYVEFRSVVQALGYKFKYDTVKKVITADSEDASFKIDLKTGATYVNGMRFLYDPKAPMIIASGANTLVLNHLFHATSYLNADYYSDKKILKVYEDPWGKPKKADLRAIRAVIDTHYQTAGGVSSITGFELRSWGTYATVSADVTIRKSGDELLDRIEHATIEMERGNGNRWTIHDIQSETEYLDFKSLLQKEAVVPETDKSAIVALMEASVKALNEENAKELVAILNPDAPLGVGISSRGELELVYQYKFLNQDFEYATEKAAVVSYEPNKATIYVVRTIRDKKNSEQPHFRSYMLLSLVKASDGKWYLNPDSDVMLDYETL
ncbi:stalk domain-containing protein [Cohnella silvisoli]|uniref:Stalk domain-containing protein n=1 Tax=Cohnella silvisoli TaxID=2873699 RepID=A0ABV1KSE6_9BACL|nr:stalk domain-containing protein [Cohnella silvisoli]MCD9022593.1 copper amine oxidase N-terminal domain-containing protein [Cohnella silvisoli]